MTTYPLFFRREDCIAGTGFIAIVQTTGRILLADEGDEGHWVYGVHPAAIAGTGENRETALRDFSRTYIQLLHEFALEADSADSFERILREFFDQDAPELQAEWHSARTLVRDHDLSLDGIQRGHEGDFQAGVEVHIVRDPAREAKPTAEPEFAYADAA